MQKVLIFLLLSLLYSNNNIALFLKSIEEAVQGLFHDAIHAADEKYFRGLRIVLGTFHESKRLKGVDSFLLRNYGPILWRSLRCANARVRAQATMLFFDAFPLQGSDASAVESDVILQKQFDLLSSLLKDGDHRVRAAAASGVCHILREYWEALPTQTTRQILSYVVGTLGHDSNCAVVRLAVVKGLGEVLDQPLSHSVLKSLLPLISDALHDKSLAVRVAFIEILKKVTPVRIMVCSFFCI
jgi:condensin-2 complex subunit G2